MEALFILNQMINIILEILEIQPSEDEPLWSMMFRTQLYERGKCVSRTEQNHKRAIFQNSCHFLFARLFLLQYFSWRRRRWSNSVDNKRFDFHFPQVKNNIKSYKPHVMYLK